MKTTVRRLTTSILSFAFIIVAVLGIPVMAASNSSADVTAATKPADGGNRSTVVNDDDEQDDDSEDDEEVEDRSAEKAKPVDPHTAEMLQLAKRGGCLACHKLERKLVGPGWMHVAERYRNDPTAREKLIDKVSRGGGGNWKEITGGQRMPPYGQRVAAADIATLVDFILSLPAAP